MECGKWDYVCTREETCVHMHSTPENNRGAVLQLIICFGL